VVGFIANLLVKPVSDRFHEPVVVRPEDLELAGDRK